MPANPRSVALSVAIQDADRAIQALRGIGEVGEAAFLKMAANGNQATVALERLDRGLEQVKGGNHGAVFQQLGYQIGDFAVQVQSGQSVLTAFVQQGSQIAGAFGPVGAVLGAAGAVAVGLAGYLAQTGQEASTAATELDHLRAGTQAYKDLLEQVQPLQQAFLEGLVQQETAARVAAERQQELNTQLQNSRPEFTGGKLEEPTYDEVVAQTSNLLPRQGLSPSDYAGQQLRRNRAREDQAIDAFVHRDLTKVVAGDQARPAFSETEEYKEQERAAKQAATAARTAAEAKARQAEAAKRLIEAMELEAASSERLAGATQLGTAARQRAQIEAEKEKKILEAGRTLKGEQLAHYKELAERLAQAQLKMVALNAATQASSDTSPAALRTRAERGSMEAYTELDRNRAAGIDQSITEMRRQLKVEQVKAATAGQAGAELQVRHQQRINELLRQGVSLTSAQGKTYLEIADTLDKISAENEKRVAQERQIERQKEILLQPWKDLVAYTSQATSDIFDEMLEKGEVSGGKLASGLQTTMRKSLAGLVGNVVTEPLNQALVKFGDSLTETLQGNGDLLGNIDKVVQENPAMAGGAFGFVAGSALDMARGKQTYAGLGGAVGGAAGAAIGTYFLPGIGTYVGGAVGSVAGSALGSLFGAGEGLGNDNSQQSYVTGSRKIEYTDKSASTQNRAVTSGVLGQIQGLQESLEGLGASFRNTALNVQAGNKSGYQLNGVKYGSEQDLLQATIKELLENASGLSATQQTVLKNTKGRTTAEVLSDVEFAKSYDRLTFKGTAFAQSLEDLDEQFAEASRKAKDLGLDTKKLAEAQGKARQDLIEQGKDNLVGMESQLRGQVQGISSFFDGLIEPLRAVANDNNDTLSPLAQINAARAKYREELALAQNGDVQGTRDLAGAAQALQQLSQRYLGNSGLGAEIARELRSGTSSVADRLEQQQAETLASLPQVQRETVAEMIRNTTRQTDRLVEEMVKLRQELRQVGGLA